MEAPEQAGRPPEVRWYESALLQSLILEAPLAVALIGFLIGNRWLLWGGLIGFGLFLALGLVCGLVVGAYVPIYAFRKWKEMTLLRKFAFFIGSLFILLCLGGILAAWIITRRNP